MDGVVDAPPPPLNWAPSLLRGNATTNTVSSVVYEFVVAEELPALDLSQTIKSKLLHPRSLHTFNRVMYRFRHYTTAMFNIGECLMIVVFVNPGQVGRWLAPVVALLEIPGVLAMLAPICFEMARLLVKSYEFWFFSTVNTLSMVCAGIAMSDARVVLLPLPWILNQSTILIDAQIRDLRHVVVAALVTTLVYVLLLVATTLQLTDASHAAVLFEHSKRRHTVTTRDLMLNCMATMIAFFTRMGYRKHSGGRQGRAAVSKAITCIGYHCKVKLRPVWTQSLTGTTAFEAPSAGLSPQTLAKFDSTPVPLDIRDRRLTQLNHSPVDKRYRARDTVWPRLTRCLLHLGHQERNEISVVPVVALSEEPPRFARHKRGSLLFLLYATGLAGFLLPALYSVFTSNSTGEASLIFLLIAGLVATSAFCGAFLAFYQRQLLLFLGTSFNFVFLSLQVTAAHVCVMDFFSWDAQRVALVCASWLWIHWVLTLDALTPVMREALGFRISFAIPVVVVFIVLQVGTVLELTWWRRLDIADHVLFSGVITGRSVEMRVAPFFLSRLMTVFIWSCRILWRMLRLNDASCELVLISGQMEFVYDRDDRSSSSTSTARAHRARKRRGRWGTLTKPRKVVPFVVKK